MSNKASEIETDKKRMVGGVLLIVVLILVIFIQNASDSDQALWPNEDDIDTARRELRLKQAELQKKLNKVELARLKREAFSASRSDYWIIKRDGQIEGNIQRIVGEIETKAGFKLSNLSNITNEKIDEGISLYKLTISAESTIEPLIKFIDGIHKAKLKFHWQSCSIRPKSNKGSDDVRFQAGLAFVVIEDEKLIAELIGSGKE